MNYIIIFSTITVSDAHPKYIGKEELKRFIDNDIISTIDNNQALGNITYADAARLKDYTLLLRDYICDHLGAEEQ